MTADGSLHVVGNATEVGDANGGWVMPMGFGDTDGDGRPCMLGRAQSGPCNGETSPMQHKAKLHLARPSHPFDPRPQLRGSTRARPERASFFFVGVSEHADGECQGPCADAEGVAHRNIFAKPQCRHPLLAVGALKKSSGKKDPRSHSRQAVGSEAVQGMSLPMSCGTATRPSAVLRLAITRSMPSANHRGLRPTRHRMAKAPTKTRLVG